MSTPNNEQQILARLLNLETLQAAREAATNTAFEALRKENVHLKQEIVDLKKMMEYRDEKAEDENSRLREEIGTLSDRMKDVDGLMTKVSTLEGHDIPGLKDEVSQAKRQASTLRYHVNGLSYRTQEFRHVSRQLSGLHGVLCRSLVDRQNIPDLYQKAEDLGSRLDDIDEKTETLEHKTSTVEQKTSSLEQKTSSVEQKTNSLEQKTSSLEQKTSSVEQKTNSLEQKTSSLEQIRDDYEQSITHARLGQPSGGLVTGKAVKMDCVTWVGSAGILDKTTGCLVSKRAGRHFVCVKLRQIGGGEINVTMKWEGESIGSYVVKTVRDDDVKTGVAVRYMNKGKNYWFEATRVKGEAKIGWCMVYCWLLSP